MNSDNTSFKNLLQSGDSRAIAHLLNKGFASGGVKVAQCDRQGSTLRMLLVGEKIDQQQKHAIDFLQKQFTQLEIQSISKLVIYAQKPDSMMPVWNEEITLLPESIPEPPILTFEDEFEEAPPLLPQPIEEPPPLITSSPSQRSILTDSQPVKTTGKSKTRQFKPPMPPARLGMAIASLLLFFPLGIAAIIISNQISSKYYHEDYQGAKSSSNMVKLLFIISASIGGLVLSVPLIAAILLPSFLSNQANEAQEAEGEQYVGSMARAQQAYYLMDSTFEDNLEELGLGIASETTSYSYDINLISPYQVVSTATPKDRKLRGFTSSVFVVQEGRASTTKMIVCAANRPSLKAPDPPTLIGGTPTCAPGSATLE
jgi:type IV pilus assembly protein PilA